MLEYFKDRQLILHSEAVNLRKGFQGLSSLCSLDQLFAGDVYIFINRRHKLLKALYWDEGGFCIFHKKLERGTFKVPMKCDLSFREFLLMIHCCNGKYFDLK